MESREEEEVTRRWKAERELEVEKERERERTGRGLGIGMGMGMIEGIRRDEEMAVAPGKKRRMVDRGERDVVEIVGEDEEERISIRNDRTAVTTGRKRKGRA